MTKLTKTFDPAKYQLVPKQLCYRSRLGLAWALGLDDKVDRTRLENAWTDALSNAPECGEILDNRMPTMDEVHRFVRSNPKTVAQMLSEANENV